MIKMVVVDLDETLLRTDKSISKYTIDIIKKVRNQGIKIIFATARGASTKSLVAYELFDGYILMNGARAYIDNRLVYEKLISADIFRPFLQELSNKGFRVAAEINSVHYSNFNVNEKWHYINDFIITDYLNISGDADKLYALMENSNQIEIINAILPDELYLNVSRDNLAMMMNKEATKWRGILSVANEFNISKNEIMAFGDDVNDIDMLSNAGFSIAMGNAIDKIKLIADDACESNDKDGIARWLEHKLLCK